MREKKTSALAKDLLEEATRVAKEREASIAEVLAGLIKEMIEREEPEERRRYR